MNAIVFDLGGVLVDWNPRYLYAPLFGADRDAMEDFLARVCAPEWNSEIDAGKPFEQAVSERQRAFPEHAELIALWRAGWPQMLRAAIGGSVDILAQLRNRGHRLIALSNWSAETFPIARSRFAFLDWFEDIVVSGEVGLIKPDPRIFALALARNRLDAARTLFIDDLPANVQTARALGMHGVLFEGPEPLRAELEQRGLL